MGFKEFWFPKDFKKQMMAGNYESSGYMVVGSMYMKEKQPKWWRFWSIMPFWGSFIFYRYGKKLADADKSGQIKKAATSKKKK